MTINDNNNSTTQNKTTEINLKNIKQLSIKWNVNPVKAQEITVNEVQKKVKFDKENLNEICLK